MISKQEIKTAKFTFGRKSLPVFVAEPPNTVTRPAPVLLLHEMPALGPATFELAQRIASHGYRVYIPLLFGRLKDDPDSRLVFLERSISFFTDPDWKAAYKNDRHLGVVDELRTLYYKNILPAHRGQRLAVIGMCISGSLPLEMAASTPEVAAPVVSQPSIPLLACSAKARGALGLTNGEIEALKARTRAGLQILGFRFEGDRICPKERFDHLNAAFGRPAFIDRTLFASRYRDSDHLPYSAHPVLTSCYIDFNPGKPESATHYAYRQLIAFLDCKLKGSTATPYSDPPED